MNTNITNKIKEKFSFNEEGRSYWLVRTNSGKFFQPYIDGNYIAIGWNFINVFDINNKNSEEIIREKLKKTLPLTEEHQKVDFNSSKGKSLITSIYNKIVKFDELKKGDIVLIPGKGSQNIAFGIIDSDDIYESTDLTCDFTKRKKVKWLNTKSLFELDNVYYKIINSKHAISSLNTYFEYIDREITNAFIKDGYGHYVIDVTTTDDIAIDELIDVINSTKEIAALLNDSLKLGDEIEENAIKLNVQSPGSIEFKFKNGVTAIILSIVMSSFVSCSKEPISNLNNSGLTEKEFILNRINTKLQNEGKLNQSESKEVVDSVRLDYDKYNSAADKYKKINVEIDYIKTL